MELDLVRVKERVTIVVSTTVKNRAGVAQNLTGLSVKVSISEYPGGSPAFTKSTPSGLDMSGAASGVVGIYFLESDFTQRRTNREGRYEVTVYAGGFELAPTARYIGPIIIEGSIL